MQRSSENSKDCEKNPCNDYLRVIIKRKGNYLFKEKSHKSTK